MCERDSKAVEIQTEDEVESHVDGAMELQNYEQGSDGEEVSHEDQQHQADIESNAHQQKERAIHIGETDCLLDCRSRAAIRPVHM